MSGSGLGVSHGSQLLQDSPLSHVVSAAVWSWLFGCCSTVAPRNSAKHHVPWEATGCGSKVTTNPVIKHARFSAVTVRKWIITQLHDEHTPPVCWVLLCNSEWTWSLCDNLPIKSLNATWRYLFAYLQADAYWSTERQLFAWMYANPWASHCKGQFEDVYFPRIHTHSASLNKTAPPTKKVECKQH